MSIKWVIALGIGTILIGLLAGYLMWGRSTQPLVSELAGVKAQLAEQTQRAEDLQRRFAEIESELKRAMEGLKAERELRQRLEEIVSKGRK